MNILYMSYSEPELQDSTEEQMSQQDNPAIYNDTWNCCWLILYSNKQIAEFVSLSFYTLLHDWCGIFVVLLANHRSPFLSWCNIITV